MTQDSWETPILQLVNQPGYKPVKPRVLAKQLGVPADDAQAFKRLIKKLVKRKLLVYGSNHLIGPPTLAKGGSATSTFTTGTFRRMAGGFGFVRPSGTSHAAGRDNDIYIAAEDAADASSGDTVLVKPRKEKAGRFRNPRGIIIEVLERQNNRFVGTYFEMSDSAYVRVDGTLFTAPISVGDPGAKNAQPNDKVVLEMVRFPSPAQMGEGVIVEVLGARGEAGVDTLSIIREFNLPEEFSEAALQAARDEADRFDEQISGVRRDFTKDTVITIDPVDARDFDDAISLERMPNGHWLLGVHIADVSHFVKVGSPLDREAYERATSVYLPDRVIPMLPEIISNGLASLQPDRVRYTQTALIEFTAEGVRVGVDMHLGAIKSQRRFTYEEVDEYLADPKAWQEKLTPEVHSLVGRMHELAMILRQRRITHGALELSLQEVKVDLDKDGRVIGAHRVENTVSHQVIEEFMLAANEAVAATLAEAEVDFLRRVHQAPSTLKLKTLTEFVAELGFETESLESRFELQRLLKEVQGRPEQHAVNYAMLRSLQRAVYSPEDEGHYALASECYTHFTSPIRRYPDLTIHRLVTSLIQKRKANRDFAELVVVGEHCSDRERRAEAAERELTRVKLLNYMQSRVGEEMDAVITGVEEFGLFVQGLAVPAEGLLRTAALADDYYTYDKSTHSLAGRRSGNTFRLGDPIRVAVVRVDVDRRELDFRLVVADQPARVPKPTRRGGRSMHEDIHARNKKRGKDTGHDPRGQPKEKRPKKRGKKRGS